MIDEIEIGVYGERERERERGGDSSSLHQAFWNEGESISD
jgi:hypothetical protein